MAVWQFLSAAKLINVKLLVKFLKLLGIKDEEIMLPIFWEILDSIVD